MKIALCMSGIPRGELQVVEFIKNMSEYHDCHLFLHTWDSSNFPNQESWSKKQSAPFSISDLPLSLDKIMHENEDYNDYAPQFKEIYDKIPEELRWRTDLGICSMFYGIKKASLLKEEYEKTNQEKFDCAFRIRFETKIRMITLENFDLSKLHIPNFETYPINDQFAFSNSTMMSYYSSCYDSIVECAKLDLYHPERILNQHLKKSNVDINLLNFGNEMML